MLDVNQSGFRLIADPADFTAGLVDTAWCVDTRSLALRQAQNWKLPRRDLTQAAASIAATMVVDSAGRYARLAADGMSVEAEVAGVWEKVADAEGKPLAPRRGRFLAVSMGGARLALLSGDAGGVLLSLFDLRERQSLDDPQNPSLTVDADPTATDVAVAPDGSIHVAGRTELLVFEGGAPVAPILATPGQFAPATLGPASLRLVGSMPHPPGRVVGISSDADRLVLLLNQGQGQSLVQVIWLLDRATAGQITIAIPATSEGTTLPVFTDIACLDQGRVALLPPAQAGDTAFVQRDVVVASIGPAGLTLAGERYPRRSAGAARFADTADGTVYYIAADRPRPLVALPHPGYRPVGAALRSGLLAGDPDTVWHRAYVEADLPTGTGIVLWARAGGDPLIDPGMPPNIANLLVTGLLRHVLELPADARSLHGDAVSDIAGVPAAQLDPFLARLNAAPLHRQPALSASGIASELPFHPGLPALTNDSGSLYEVLLQRSLGGNRRMVGRMLDLVFVLSGDGRHTPRMFACRAYAPRFSYQQQYLPKLYQQTQSSDEALDLAPRPLPPDFRERMLANLEGMLTAIEGRAAAAELLLDPLAAPVSTLPWLASFLGRAIDTAWPEARQRRSIATAGQLLQWRGTYRGVCLALDVATDGAVRRGEVVVVENFRLRRTMATILGIEMDDDNPMTLNARASGNSIIGDTLILSVETGRAFLALFAPDLARRNEAAAVRRFFDQYENRVTILLHGAAQQQRPVVENVLAAEMPAHLWWDVYDSDHSFVLGLSPLLGIDSFLDPPPPVQPVTLNQSRIGRDAVIHDSGTLVPADPGRDIAPP
jgi:phage tail-like protein